MTPKPPECTCVAWQDQIHKINAPIELQQIRAGRSFPADHFIAWHFCPWCGKSLVAAPSAVSPEAPSTPNSGSTGSSVGVADLPEAEPGFQMTYADAVRGGRAMERASSPEARTPEPATCSNGQTASDGTKWKCKLEPGHSGMCAYVFTHPGTPGDATPGEPNHEGGYVTDRHILIDLARGCRSTDAEAGAIYRVLRRADTTLRSDAAAFPVEDAT